MDELGGCCFGRVAFGEASSAGSGLIRRKGVVRRAGDCSAPPDAILALVGARDIHVPLLRNPRPGEQRFGYSLPGLR